MYFTFFVCLKINVLDYSNARCQQLNACMHTLSFSLNVDREVLFIEVSLSATWRIFFHPAKLDNFKDEKISDYKTVAVAQGKNLLD